MDPAIGRYWPFAAICFVIAATIVRLVARERLTLQGSLYYLVLLLVLLLAAMFPGADAVVTRWMGFALVSNWFFAVSIAGLSLLHLSALVGLSRSELRTIALTQQVAILEERVNRMAGEERG